MSTLAQFLERYRQAVEEEKKARLCVVRHSDATLTMFAERLQDRERPRYE